jgi:hypothetical protein
MADEKENIELRNHHVSNLWTSTWKGLMQMLEQAPQTWRGPDTRFYRDEKEWIIQSANPIFTGIFVSTFCFIAFRVSASRWWTQLQKKTYFARNHPPQLPIQSIAKEQQSASRQPWRSTLERQAEQRTREISEFSQLPIDFVLSILLGCSSFYLLHDSKKFRRDFSSSPLVPGKSLIYVHVCPEVAFTLQELQQDENFRNMMNLTDDADETLAMFQTFVKNCQIRSAFIQNQTDGTRPDVVPYPGLANKQQEF